MVTFGWIESAAVLGKGYGVARKTNMEIEMGMREYLLR